MGIWFVIKRIGWFIVDHWKIVVPAIVLIFAAFWFRSCWAKHKAKLNEQQIVAAQQAIATQDREAMTKVLVEADVAEKQIDANLANSDHQKLEAIQEARRKAAQMTNAELAATLEEMAKE